MENINRSLPPEAQDWYDEVIAAGERSGPAGLGGDDDDEGPLFQVPKIIRWTNKAIVFCWKLDNGDECYITISKDAVSFMRSEPSNIKVRKTIRLDDETNINNTQA